MKTFMEKVPFNAMYLGLDVRPKGKPTRLEHGATGLERGDSFYTCQDMYSGLKPIKEPGDPSVKTTHFFPGDK